MRFILFALFTATYLASCGDSTDRSVTESVTQLKFDIDPMPGVFAGEMARLQALLNLMLKSLSFTINGQPSSAEALLTDGLDELMALQAQIDSGEIATRLGQEKQAWVDFIQAAAAIDPSTARDVFDALVV